MSYKTAKECVVIGQGATVLNFKSAFRLAVRKKFFIIRVVRYSNRLSREVLDIPSLEVLKVRLEGPLSNVIY